MPQEKLLTTKEAADLLRIHPYTLTAMARNGEIEALRPRRHWKFRPASIQAYMENPSQSQPKS